MFSFSFFCTAQHFSYTHQIWTWSNNSSFFLKVKQIWERENCFLFAAPDLRNFYCLLHLEWSLTQSEWKPGTKGSGEIKCIHFASQHSMNGAFIDVFDIWWNPCNTLIDLTERDAGLIWYNKEQSHWTGSFREKIANWANTGQLGNCHPDKANTTHRVCATSTASVNTSNDKNELSNQTMTNK